MTITLEMLQAQVLRLSPQDRARLLDKLLASLDADVQTEAAWDAVAQERDRQIESGEVQPVPLDEALARLEARFRG